MEIINWKLASHPINWLTLWLMVALALLAIHIVMPQFGVRPKGNAS